MPQTLEPETATNQQTLLFFALGPVQPFIEKARSVRDLMTGSYLLAWLTKQAICGAQLQANLITPHSAQIEMAQAPKLPNRFIAQLPMDAEEAEKVAQTCRTACRDAWLELSGKVHDAIAPKISQAINARIMRGDLSETAAKQLEQASQSWDRLWYQQIGNHESEACLFDIHTHTVAATDDVIEKIKSKPPLVENDRQSPEDWDWAYDFAWALDGARKSNRHIHPYTATTTLEEFPAKCTMFGTYEQMGPSDTEGSRVFWETLAGLPADEKNGHPKISGIHIRMARLRKRERLSAIGLVKRFAWPAHLQEDLTSNGTHQRDQRVEIADTATVAAQEWLAAPGRELIEASQELKDTPGHKELVWSGQWLHWRHSSVDKDERECPEKLFRRIRDAVKLAPDQVPTYYAIMMLDGDKMGDKGRERNGATAQRELSELIGGFAGDMPKQIEDHFGTLIYAGGDDVLALLPVSQALQCGASISQKFSSIWQGSAFAPTTVSAGIAIAHHKEDLRFVLNAARSAEKLAKDSGRDALALSVCRRSGQHTTAVMDWKFCSTVQGWVQAFRATKDADGKSSSRWTYTLAEELPVLQHLEKPEAVRAEIQRLVNRSNADKTHGEQSVENPEKHVFQSDKIGKAFDAYLAEHLSAQRHPNDGRFLSLNETDQQRFLLKRAVHGFVTLCQSAAFLARGRDQ